MHETTLNLGRAAGGVRAEVLGLAFVPHEAASALGAILGKIGPAKGRIAFAELHARNFRNNLSALFHIDIVADSHVQQLHLVGVVQASPLYRGARKQHRLKVCHRGHRSGPSDLIVNGKEFSEGLFSLEFVGDGPPWELRRVAQGLLVGKFVDLDDDAVGRKRKLAPLGVPILYIFFNLVDVAADFPLVRNGESPGLGNGESLRVGLERKVFSKNVVESALQASFPNFLRVEKLQGT